MNIFVGNLSAAVTADDLRQLFGGYGTIINAIVMRDTATGLPLGYGHVYLVPEQAACEAIINLHNTLLNGSHLCVRECVYRARPEQRMKRKTWQGVERRVAGARRHKDYDLSTPSSRQQQTG
ncbi:MAG TPA: RNA-binding protein [Sulfuricaulis sp.]|nr:RNA-binding protein [Sulfuricaulis sp.]